MVYRVEVFDNYDSSEDFIEAVSERAVATSETPASVIVVATTKMLQADKLRNIALKFFGENGYIIDELGLLGPFRE